jgi:hypothetical protein
MNRLITPLGITLICAGFQSADASLYRVEFSPEASRALNLGTVVYPGDHAEGLSGRNENPQNTSTAFGDVLNGMSYDDSTNIFAFDFGYGSGFGFSDLLSDWNGGVHIHGNGTNTALFPAVNANAGVIYDLGSSHTASGTRSGRVTGTRTLTATHETWLLDNQLYINIHSTNLPGGEIRGQLVIVPEPATVLLGFMALLPAMFVRRRGS